MKVLYTMDQSYCGGTWMKMDLYFAILHDKIEALLELKCNKTKSMQFPFHFYYQLYFIYVKVLICWYYKYLPFHRLG